MPFLERKGLLGALHRRGHLPYLPLLYGSKRPDESDEQFQQSVNARFRALRFAGAESDLQTIPGVGKNIAQDLIDLGYPTVESLRGQDPEELYRKDCLRKGRIEDRCQLYVFREAVYFAGQEEHDPEKLKWWNWKD